MRRYEDDYGWKPYVRVAERRRQAAREAARLAQKGQTVSPVVIKGSKIANTFWGKAWCDNLERYSDYSNRLPDYYRISDFLLEGIFPENLGVVGVRVRQGHGIYKGRFEIHIPSSTLVGADRDRYKSS